ncbi:MAG: double-strand break repair helicase AddA [Mesorhizobium sp.]
MIFNVPPATVAAQALASDPKGSAWVSANAGSGKTHVLAQRVIRLLLDGADPSRILCLTYTKAAAANMSNRVFKNLAAWTVMDDAALAKEIFLLDGRQADAGRLAQARRLFARALETPGGLKIQTIHAFCEAILHQFPLEANIAGHFEMLDGQKEQALVAEARRDILTGLVTGEHPELVAALDEIIALAGEDGLDKLLGEIVGRRDALARFIDQTGSDFAALFDEFGFSHSDDPRAIAATIWPDDYFNASLAQRIGDRASTAGKKLAEDFAADLQHATTLADPLARLGFLVSKFVTQDKETKEAVPKSASRIMSKGVAEHFPDFVPEFDRYAMQLAAAADRVALLRMLHATRAALTLADVLISRYEQMKAARGFLDFNDLITRTVRLLSRDDVGPWVAYKLDRGIDHILVDEAQDTSPDQWQVVRKLAGEFFAGAGARSRVERTIFAVGDEKQSIYSFQGADPRSFSESGAAFSRQAGDAGNAFEQVRLHYSFRSTLDVLSAVDTVFAGEAARKGLSADNTPVAHDSVRDIAAGHVDVWPLVEPTSVDTPEDWAQPVDHASAPAVVLADRIARTIKSWIDNGETIGSRDGPPHHIRPGNILVLVRKRDRFIHALTRALKNLHVPVAGADRLSLPGHIAVKDLIAIGRVAMQPDDDLSLAALLRSPVFAVSEDKLYDLAWNRPGTLLASLRSRENDARISEIAATLDRWANEAATRPVFEFYGGVLARDGVRSKMVARLGPSAGEIIDEFQNFTLAAERTGLPGLEAFLATLESAGPDIKREVDQTRNEVRIMTVHASKGLEAPVVFLVDSAGAPSSEHHLPRLSPLASSAGKWAGYGFLWRASSELGNSVSRGINRELRDRAEDEYRRLLYVGMTRAEERLIVCGYRGIRTPPQGIWHDMVWTALGASERTKPETDPIAGDVLRYRFHPPISPAEEDKASASATEVTYPPLQPLPPARHAGPSLSPSAASALLDPPPEPVVSAKSPVFDPQDEPSFAIARGLAIHRLLQVLPDMAPDEREAAARRYLSAAGQAWPKAERDRAWTSVETVLADGRFAPVFAQGSRAEIAISGRIAINDEEHTVSGTIDRLAVVPDRVMCVDFKTNRPPPQTLEEVPQAYIVQMALYARLLSEVYPGREITAGLLFTEAPRLIELPRALLDASLERLTRA